MSRPGSPGMLWRIVGVAAELALTAGVLLGLFALWLVFWTAPAGAGQATRTVLDLQRQWIAAPPAPVVVDVPVLASSSDAVWVRSTAAPVAGRAFAILQIPRFGANWRMPVLEGTDPEVLRGGVGHYVGSALPGAIGNLALAGHRTTWGRPFRQIETLRVGDEVSVQTRLARFTYRVTGHEVVPPSRRDVLDPVPGRPGAVPVRAGLTLTTCHPEYSARERWVVHAVLVP